MPEIKNTIIEMKNAFDGLSNRLHMAEERISDLGDISTGISKTEKQGEKDKKQNRITKNVDN